MDATQVISDANLEDEESDEERPDHRPLAKLCILKNEHIPAAELPLFSGDNVLGRDPACDLHLAAPSVSKQHLVVSVTVHGGHRARGAPDMETLVWDLGSMNGTRKGRLKLTPHVRYALGDGDGLVVADVPCRFVSSTADTPSSPPGGPGSGAEVASADFPSPGGGDRNAVGQQSAASDIRRSSEATGCGVPDRSRTPVPNTCLSLEETPAPPQGTLVPDSDSDSDAERQQRPNKRLGSDDDSRRSGSARSSFLSPANRVVPESEDENPVTPSPAWGRRLEADSEEEEEEEEDQRRRDELWGREGEERAAVPVLDMDSDTDLEEEVATAPKNHTPEQQREFHMDSDTDIDEDPQPSPGEAAGAAARPGSLAAGSDTDVDEADMPDTAAHAKRGHAADAAASDLHLHSDTEEEEEEEEEEAPPVVEQRMGVVSAGAPAAFEDSDTDQDVTFDLTAESNRIGTKKEEEEPRPSSAPLGPPATDPDDDTDVEGEGEDQNPEEPPGPKAPRLQNCSTPLHQGAVAEMETQAFSSPCEGPLRWGGPSQTAELSCSDEDLVVAETQPFVVGGPEDDSAQTPGPERDGTGSFLLGLSDSGHRQGSDPASEETQEYTDGPPTDLTLQETQAYIADPAEEEEPAEEELRPGSAETQLFARPAPPPRSPAQAPPLAETQPIFGGEEEEDEEEEDEEEVTPARRKRKAAPLQLEDTQPVEEDQTWTSTSAQNLPDNTQPLVPRPPRRRPGAQEDFNTEPLAETQLVEAPEEEEEPRGDEEPTELGTASQKIPAGAEPSQERDEEPQPDRAAEKKEEEEEEEVENDSEDFVAPRRRKSRRLHFEESQSQGSSDAPAARGAGEDREHEEDEDSAETPKGEGEQARHAGGASAGRKRGSKSGGRGARSRRTEDGEQAEPPGRQTRGRRGASRRVEEEKMEGGQAVEVERREAGGAETGRREMEGKEVLEAEEEGRRGRRAARRTVAAATPAAEPDGDDVPAKRTRSRSNSSNSVSSERSVSAGPPARGRGQGAARRRRRTVAAAPEENLRDLHPGTIANPGISVEISQRRGRGRGSSPPPPPPAATRGRKRQPAAPQSRTEETNQEPPPLKRNVRGQRSARVQEQGAAAGEETGRARKAEQEETRRSGGAPAEGRLPSETAAEVQEEDRALPARRGRRGSRAGAGTPGPRSPEPEALTPSRKRGPPVDVSSPAAKTPRSRGGASPRASSQAYKVLFTGVVDEAGEKILARLGGGPARGVADMNVLVTDKVRRTVKFLCALAKGVPIVTPLWLEKSGRAGSFLSPLDFIVDDPEQEEKFGFRLRESLQAAAGRTLLQGFHVHVTRSVKPEPVHMRDIISCGGASFLSRMPSSHKPQTIVVSCEEDLPLCTPAFSASVPVVSAEFILSGILQQRLDFGSHALAPPPPVPDPPPATARGRRKT